MRRSMRIPAGFALLLLAACGGESDSGQPDADDRRALDNIARQLDEQQQDQTFDTSPDSLVLNQSAVQPPASGGNAAAPAAVPANQSGNAAGQR